MDDFGDAFLNAVYSGNIKKVSEMLEAGENPNIGNTPLAIAESNGFTDIVAVLMKHGAKESKSESD